MVVFIPYFFDTNVIISSDTDEIESYKSTLYEVARYLEKDPSSPESKECPSCKESKVLDSISLFSGKAICSNCRQHEEACDFLGILPEA